MRDVLVNYHRLMEEGANKKAVAERPACAARIGPDQRTERLNDTPAADPPPARIHRIIIHRRFSIVLCQFAKTGSVCRRRPLSGRLA